MRKIAIGWICVFLMATVPYIAENYFKTLLCKSDGETRKKMDSVWSHFFTPGDINVYGEDRQSCVYKPDVFDRLWRWSKEHMAYGPETAWDGYFCWQYVPDTPYPGYICSILLICCRHGLK